MTIATTIAHNRAFIFHMPPVGDFDSNEPTAMIVATTST